MMQQALQNSRKQIAILTVLAFILGTTTDAANVTWNAGSGNWDNVTASWTGDAVTYTEGDAVTFEDTSGSGGSIDIQDVNGGGVTPASVTVTGNLDYTFTGNSILGGSLSKSGAGNLTLSNSANSFSSINVGGGVLQFSNPSQLGASTSQINFSADSILFYNAAASPSTLSNPINIANGTTATIELDHAGGSSIWQIDGQITGGTAANPIRLKLIELVLGGGSFDDVRLTNSSNSFVGTLEIAQRTEFKWSGDDGVFGDAASTVAVTGNGVLDLQGNTLTRDILAGGVRNGTLAGVVTGGLAPQGTVTLTNTGNSLTRVTLSQSNTAVVSEPGNLGGASTVWFASYNANGGNLRITGTPTGDWTDTIQIEAEDADIEVVDPNAVVNWTGNVATRSSGPAPSDYLRKTGAGTLNLNKIDGVLSSSPLVLTVANGRLNLNDATPSTNAFDNLTVQSGGTLGGDGTIDLAAGKSVTVNAGGILSPGTSIGTLTIDGTTAFESASTFAVEVGGAGAGQYDRLVVTDGTVSLAAGSELALDFGAFAATLDDAAYILDNQTASPIAGQFQYGEGDLLGTFNGYKWLITYQAVTDVALSGGNDIAIFAVPEPTSGLLVLLVSLGLLARRRQRA